MDLMDKRIQFKISVAARSTAKDLAPRVVYVLNDKVSILTVEEYLKADLDAKGATRVCQIGKLIHGQDLPRFRYDPHTETFTKS